MAYDDVPASEAIDLVLTLPRGSLYVGAVTPYGRWDDAAEQRAQIVDKIARFITLYATGSTEGSRVVERPWMAAERRRVAERTRRAVRTLNETKWKDVDHG